MYEASVLYVGRLLVRIRIPVQAAHALDVHRMRVIAQRPTHCVDDVHAVGPDLGGGRIPDIVTSVVKTVHAERAVGSGPQKHVPMHAVWNRRLIHPAYAGAPPIHYRFGAIDGTELAVAHE